MTGNSETFQSVPEQDFRVCLFLDAVCHRLPDVRPTILFKGGKSPSKAFGLTERISEDIGLASRVGFGFESERDLTGARGLSNRRRAAPFFKLRTASSVYICGDLKLALARLIDGYEVVPNGDDVDGQTLFVHFPAPNPSPDIAYAAPRVVIEGIARSELESSLTCTTTLYVADEQPDWPFDFADIRVIALKRTFSVYTADKGAQKVFQRTGTASRATTTASLVTRRLIPAGPRCPVWICWTRSEITTSPRSGTFGKGSKIP